MHRSSNREIASVAVEARQSRFRVHCVLLFALLSWFLFIQPGESDKNLSSYAINLLEVNRQEKYLVVCTKEEYLAFSNMLIVILELIATFSRFFFSPYILKYSGLTQTKYVT